MGSRLTYTNDTAIIVRKTTVGVLIIILAGCIATAGTAILDVAKSKAGIATNYENIRDLKADIRDDLKVIKQDIKELLSR